MRLAYFINTCLKTSINTFCQLVAVTALLASALAAQAQLDPNPATRLAGDLRCLLGVYALPGGHTLTITGAAGQTRALGYTRSSGHFGELKETADGSFVGDGFSLVFAPCNTGSLTLQQSGSRETANRVPLMQTTTRFTSDGISLHGKLIAPAPAAGPVQSLAVWIEGSNNNPSTDDAVWPFELARRGVAVFVYDKRGTGASQGTPSSDFYARARDSAAALQAARAMLPGVKHVGAIGGSQGGWVAPLTAKLLPLDFVVTAYALADGPLAQDQALLMQHLQNAGFGEPTTLAHAKALAQITARILPSNIGSAETALAELDRFKAQHAGAAWLASIPALSHTGILLKYSSEIIKTHGPAMAQGLSLDYEPRPVIESISARQLWLLAGSDRQAPNAHTQDILRQMQQRGHDMAVVVFPRADHGLIENVPSADGARQRYAPRVFDVAADWINQHKLPAAGRFITLAPTQ